MRASSRRRFAALSGVFILPDLTRIYTKPGCPYCAAAMADMRARDVPFTQIDVQGDLVARKTMEKLSGGLRVPTIVQPDGSVVVGFDGY